MKKMYKLLALVISLAMLISALPVGAFEGETLEEPSVIEEVIEVPSEEPTEEIIQEEASEEVAPEEILGGGGRRPRRR